LTVAEGDQLSLAIDSTAAGARLPARIRPMQPSNGDGPFDDADYFFEPWWPGSRTILYLDGQDVRLQAEHMADPLAAFPELAAIRGQVREPVMVLDGTLLVLDDAGRPDEGLLRQRLAATGAGGSRGVPAFVATDLLQLGERPLTGRPFGERRDRLETLVPDGDWCVVGRGYRQEGTMVAEALQRMGLDAMSARRLSARYVPGDAGDAWLRLPLVAVVPRHERPTLTLIQRLPLQD
jgi:bifunctional non-homologous end joining protein LigD